MLLYCPCTAPVTPACLQYNGVSFDKRKHRWFSQIQQHGKRHFLGYYDSELGAAAAYDRCAVLCLLCCDLHAVPAVLCQDVSECLPRCVVWHSSSPAGQPPTCLSPPLPPVPLLCRAAVRLYGPQALLNLPAGAAQADALLTSTSATDAALGGNASASAAAAAMVASRGTGSAASAARAPQPPVSTPAGALVKPISDAGTAAGVAAAAAPAAAVLPEPQQQQQQQGQPQQHQQQLSPEQFQQQLQLHLLQQQLVATLHKAAAAAPGPANLLQTSAYQPSALVSQQAPQCLLQMIIRAAEPGSTPAAALAPVAPAGVHQQQQQQQPNRGGNGSSSSSSSSSSSAATAAQWLLGRLAALQMLSPPQQPQQQPARLIVVPAAAPSSGRSLSGNKRGAPELSLPPLFPAQQLPQPQPAKRAHLLGDASAGGLLALLPAAVALRAAPVVATQESAAAAAGLPAPGAAGVKRADPRAVAIPASAALPL